jgi:hypothetical protein
MKTFELVGFFRRIAICVLALGAGLAVPFAASAVEVATRPAEARAGDFVSVEISGTFPREDFWITETVLMDLRLVERSGGEARYEAVVNLYYHWAPLYVADRVRTPYSALVPLGQFDSAATVDLRILFLPMDGVPFNGDIDPFAEATVRIGSGTAGCAANEVRLNGSGACANAIRFGTFSPGERSDEVPVTVRNSGRGPLYLGAFSLNSADYGMTRRCGETIEPGQSCEVLLTFSPSIDGASPGRLTILYGNDPEQKPFESAVVSLTGDSRANAFVAPTRGSRVVEYHASSTDQYFLTADEKDMRLLDPGTLGWRRTGVEFIASGAFETCRFFGDPVAGPNGHFYTARVDACNALRLKDTITPRGQQAYRYEGIAFPIGLPLLTENDARYRCPDGTRPLYLFTRPAGGGRHLGFRLIPAGPISGSPTGDALARTMLSQGWSYLGHAMCSEAPLE